MSEGDKKKDEQTELKVVGIFAEASGFEQLFKILQDEEEISGSGGNEYRAVYLILTINQFRNGLKSLQQKVVNAEKISMEAIKGVIAEDGKLMDLIRCITREEGLRSKVVQLAIKEATARVENKGLALDLNQDTSTAEKKKENNNGK